MNNKLRLLLIKPSHYDNEGYVVQWWLSLVPNHSLAVVNGILLDAAERQVLSDVEFEIKVMDEIATVIQPEKLLPWLHDAERALVMLVGVQTSQYPRAVDLAQSFIKGGIPAAIGGFHVSGILSLTPDWEQGLAAARNIGATLFAGELEESIDEFLNDIWCGELKSLYNKLKPNIDMERAPIARLDKETVASTYHTLVGMDLGRGCPYLCSFCTVINVHGRRPRQRTAIAAANYVRQCKQDGIHRFLVIDDNFARNQNWESICDEFIRLKEQENIEIDLFIQVDTLASSIKGFVEKVSSAGCKRVFIGIESVREDNLNAAVKNQNKKAQLSEMAATWHQAGIMIYGAFIIGFPNDTPERIAEDVRFIQENIDVDILEFFLLTPLPGSVDHKKLLEAGAVLDDDFSRYTDEQPVNDHPLMSREQWQKLYHDAWNWFYSDKHMERIIRNGIRDGLLIKEVIGSLVLYYGLPRYEGVHPLVGGLIRRKVRHQRRVGFDLESVWCFYPRYLWHTIKSQGGLFWLWFRLRWKLKMILWNMDDLF